MFNRSNFLGKIVRALGASALALGLCLPASPSAFAQSAQMTCYQMQSNCLLQSHREQQADAAAGVTPDPVLASDNTCYDAYNAAEQTGTWPAIGPFMAFTCTP